MSILNLERSNLKKSFFSKNTSLLSLVFIGFPLFLFNFTSNYLHSVDFLLSIILLLTVFIVIITFIPSTNLKLIKQLGLGFSCFIFILSLVL